MLSFLRKEAAPPLVSNITNVLRHGDDLLSNEKIIVTEKLAANLFCSGEVMVGSDAVVSGNIIADVCAIEGTIQGDVSTTGRLELKSTAVIKGDIKAPVLDIEEGAIINGRVSIKQEVTAIKVELLNKLNKFAADELSPSKVKSATAEIEPGQTMPGRKTEVKPAYGTLRAPEKREVAVEEIHRPVQKELSAAIPQPKVVEETEVNNRWW